MTNESHTPRPLTLKPDLPEAARRWEAYFAGEMLDRPIVCVTAPKHGALPPWEYRYRQKVFGDIDAIIDEALARAEATYYAGEAIPSFFPSFGPDEIAVFTGAEFLWSEDSGETNWSVPYRGGLGRSPAAAPAGRASALAAHGGAEPARGRAAGRQDADSAHRPAHQHGSVGGGARPATAVHGPTGSARGD